MRAIRLPSHGLLLLAALALAPAPLACCSEQSTSPASSAASSASPTADVPHKRLLGTWAYGEPTKEQLKAIERRSRSVNERERRLRDARQLAKVTKTYTVDERIVHLGTGKPVRHRYEVVKLDDHAVTLRLSPLGTNGKTFEETLEFVGEDQLREIVEGVPQTLTRR